MKALLLIIALAITATAQSFPHWAPGTQVRVAFIAHQFTEKEKLRVQAAIDSWHFPAGITMKIVGETEYSQDCNGCLTFNRDDARSGEWGDIQANHWAGSDIINHAIISLDKRAGSGQALQRIAAHEVGHSLGLLDQAAGGSVMSSKWHKTDSPYPTVRDGEAVRMVYEERNKTTTRDVAVMAISAPDRCEFGEDLLRLGAQAELWRIEQATREALTHYSFRRTVLIQTLDKGIVSGEYQRISRMSLADDGARFEKVVHQYSTLRSIKITKQDEQDFSGAQMGIVNFSNHRFSQSSTGIIVEPTSLSERGFRGEIQIDSQGRITRLEGTTLPENDERFPKFVSTRKDVDGYLFPSETFGEGVLRFPSGDVLVRWRIEFSEYRKFSTSSVIKEIGSR